MPKLLPGWLGKLPIDTSFVYHNVRKLLRAEVFSDAINRLVTVAANKYSTNGAETCGGLTRGVFRRWGVADGTLDTGAGDP